MLVKGKGKFGPVAALLVLLLLFLRGEPVYAAGNAVIPVRQTLTVASGSESPGDQSCSYTLRAEHAGDPMPSGSSGSEYTFTITGTNDHSVGPITTYSAPGVYSYTLRQTAGTAAHYSYDTRVYHISVYVVNVSGTLKTEVFVKRSGTKYARAEFEVKYNKPSVSARTSGAGASGRSGAAHDGSAGSFGGSSGVSSGGKGFLGSGRGGVRTGDESMLMLIGGTAAIVLGAMLLIGFLVWKNRENREDEETGERQEEKRKEQNAQVQEV